MRKLKHAPLFIAATQEEGLELLSKTFKGNTFTVDHTTPLTDDAVVLLTKDCGPIETDHPQVLVLKGYRELLEAPLHITSAPAAYLLIQGPLKEEERKEIALSLTALGLFCSPSAFKMAYSSFKDEAALETFMRILEDLYITSQGASYLKPYQDLMQQLMKSYLQIDETLSMYESFALALSFLVRASRKVGLLSSRVEQSFLGILNYWGYPVSYETTLDERVQCAQNWKQQENLLYLFKAPGVAQPFSFQEEAVQKLFEELF